MRVVRSGAVYVQMPAEGLVGPQEVWATHHLAAVTAQADIRAVSDVHNYEHTVL